MRDDPEYWDALTTRIVATVRERRQSSWLVWAAPLATAALLMLFLANRRAPPVNGAPNIAVMMTAPGPPPSLVTMLRGRP